MKLSLFFTLVFSALLCFKSSAGGPLSKKWLAIPTDSVKNRADSAEVSPFKKAILEVLKSFRESGYWDVRMAERTGSNFWGYKFTYTTRLKIPGEKFNMLYCFPFVYSKPDFVSVLKESNGYDSSFETVYHQFEKKLLKDFTPAEGWTSSCIVNVGQEKLPDLEFHHDYLGSVVLDYSRSAQGKYILYLRFLWY
jgi:hypothetical protein